MSPFLGVLLGHAANLVSKKISKTSEGKNIRRFDPEKAAQNTGNTGLIWAGFELLPTSPKQAWVMIALGGICLLMSYWKELKAKP